MSNGKTGTCDTTSHTCNYTCDASTTTACTVGGTTTCIPKGDCCTNSDCTGTCMACDPTSHTCVAAKSEADPNGRCTGTCDSTGACKAKQGQVCTAVSGGCVSGTTCSGDGYCCNTACGGSGSCAGTCSTGTCVYPTVACGGSGVCTGACSAGACVYPTVACGGSGVCAGTCSAGTCAYPTVACGGSGVCTGTCSAGTCAYPKVACGGSGVCAGACSTGTCVYPTGACGGSGVCAGTCSTGTCAFPTGSCGGSGVCTGTCSGGTCAFPTVSCGSMCSGTSSYIGAGSCSNGTCGAPAAQPCANHFACSQNACNNGCLTDSDCASGYFCEAATCHLAAVSVGAGAYHACAVLSDGTVRCWGSDTDGELGNGTSSNSGFTQSTTPVAVLGLTNVKAVGAGLYTTCALRNDGTVWCWGDDSKEQEGPTGVAQGYATTPIQVTPGLGSASAMSVGADHTCALVGGQIECWGSNQFGEFGDGAAAFADSTVETTTGLTGVTTVSTGWQHTCAGSGSQLWCWGDDSAGEVGNGTVIIPGIGSAPPETPQAVTLSTTAKVVMVAAGYSDSCAVFNNGNTYCWGSINGATTPQAVTGLSNPTAVSAGNAVVCALNGNGTLMCWGDNTYGELGNPNVSGSSSSTPVAVVGLPSTVTSFSAGGGFVCAVVKNGSVWCWGENMYGVLGAVTSSVGSSSPFEIPGW
jgi:alpha-tubulin suppressor-like RCC1 family protein